MFRILIAEDDPSTARLLGAIVKRAGYEPLTAADGVRALELLPPQTVIGRLTGDGMAADLLAPAWSRKKIAVLNDIDKALYAADSWQGKLYKQ